MYCKYLDSEQSDECIDFQFICVSKDIFIPENVIQSSIVMLVFSCKLNLIYTLVIKTEK